MAEIVYWEEKDCVKTKRNLLGKTETGCRWEDGYCLMGRGRLCEGQGGIEMAKLRRGSLEKLVRLYDRER
jgi:hypothetical protein